MMIRCSLIVSVLLCLLTIGAQGYSMGLAIRDTLPISTTHSIDQMPIHEYDPLQLSANVLSEIVIKSKKESASSVSILQRTSEFGLKGTAAIINQVPGVFSDRSTGEVFTRLHSRGISLSAEDDIGWYYSSLQEDGLPITAVNYNYFTPDLFHRADISVQRVEVIKGGISGIMAQNSPGTVVNFVSQTPADELKSQHMVTSGIHQNGNFVHRLEGFYNGPFSTGANQGFNVSYLYRYDQGDRNIPYALSNGGQIKSGYYNKLSNGIISIKLKYLRDHTNRNTGVPAMDWNDPVPLDNYNFNNSSLFVPSTQDAQIADGRGSGSGTYTYDPRNGIEVRELSGVFSIALQGEKWRLSNNIKYSKKDLDWQTVIGGQPLGLDDFLTYFVSGDGFPVGAVEFTDVSSGAILATVDNQQVLNAFQGLPPGFEYLGGSLPGDAIMGSGAWKKDDGLDEFMNDFRFTIEGENQTLTSGLFFAHSDLDIFTNASFIYSTYEPESRLLSVSLSTPDQPTRFLSDDNGLSNYGGLLLEQANFNIDQLGLFLNWEGKLSDRLKADLGLRYELIHHGGEKFSAAPITSEDLGGYDGSFQTGYDNGVLGAGSPESIDYNYNYLSYSIGAQYRLANHIYSYGRYTSAHKAPELNYYTQNFPNIPVNSKGEVQNIDQLELGVKAQTGQLHITGTAFTSKLSNVPYTSFEFDEQSNQIFYNPTQLNSSSTYGLELESFIRLSENWDIQLSGTFQKSKLKDFSLYDSGGTIDLADDQIVNFSNTVPHQPAIMTRLGTGYKTGRTTSKVQLNYMGRRYGNFENSFMLPDYCTVDLFLEYEISDAWKIGLRALNAFNSAGLNNFFGPNSFGSSANAATADFIAANPNASFVVFPISGRTAYLSIGYTIN